MGISQNVWLYFRNIRIYRSMDDKLGGPRHDETENLHVCLLPKSRWLGAAIDHPRSGSKPRTAPVMEWDLGFPVARCDKGCAPRYNGCVLRALDSTYAGFHKWGYPINDGL